MCKMIKIKMKFTCFWICAFYAPRLDDQRYIILGLFFSLCANFNIACNVQSFQGTVFMIVIGWLFHESRPFGWFSHDHLVTVTLTLCPTCPHYEQGVSQTYCVYYITPHYLLSLRNSDNYVQVNKCSRVLSQILAKCSFEYGINTMDAEDCFIKCWWMKDGHWH